MIDVSSISVQGDVVRKGKVDWRHWYVLDRSGMIHRSTASTSYGSMLERLCCTIYSSSCSRYLFLMSFHWRCDYGQNIAVTFRQGANIHHG